MSDPPGWIEPASPDEDSESVCSSQDGCSVASEEGAVVGAGGATTEEEIEEDIEMHLAEHIDQLSDKKWVI